ncbi:hypothetical protein PIB19_00620 [Sphingomonas sp. 7/4-4]|uniref:hypothetical protein n=1 Tax=Sphingomonas sp. 7/4-4 TaxID=3018446 RepID=UPI0022F3B5FE|nr:hypothetical protein [Sphingomonas sp. 7/4-4]WBY08100.1 hypothetical protein PIB19_00620 [Sphingomonas sp. 7/4-4]
MAGGLLVARLTGDAGLAGECDLALLDFAQRPEHLGGDGAGQRGDVGERGIERGGIGLARKHCRDQRLALLDARRLELGGFLRGGDFGLHLRDLRAHPGDLRFGRTRSRAHATDGNRTGHRLRHAIAREQHGDRRDAGEQRLGAAGNAEATQIAAVVENKIAGGEKIAEPLA